MDVINHQRVTTAEDAIYSRVDAPEDAPGVKEIPPFLSLLDYLDSAECLSLRGRILHAWLTTAAGRTLRSSDPAVVMIAARLDVNLVNVLSHLRAISRDPLLSPYFRYVYSPRGVRGVANDLF